MQSRGEDELLMRGASNVQDGDKLDMTATPEDEEMEGGEIIEVGGPGVKT